LGTLLAEAGGAARSGIRQAEVARPRRLRETGAMLSIPPAPPALRLRLDGAALAANFRWFEACARVPAIPAVKADGYGLGAPEVVRRLEGAGARTFAVATWAEAAALARPDLALLVLHGFTADCTATAAALPLARPVLNTSAQCARWKAVFPGRAADLMVDTGMNRLGLAPGDLSAADGIPLAMVHSHFACADLPDHPLTRRQIARFREVAAATPGVPHALANSAGVGWGTETSFDAVRPGLGLVAGNPYPAIPSRRVVFPEARVIQVRDVPAGDPVGYGASWIAPRDSRIAIVNIGYADGIPRALGPHLELLAGDRRVRLAGRISMDMLAADVTETDVAEGDWLALDWDLPKLAAAIGASQFELLVRLSRRFERIWF
jgi:alanine racemase